MLAKFLDYLIGLICITLLLYGCWHGYNQIKHAYPTSVLQLSGQLDYVDIKKLRYSLLDVVATNLWAIDVERVKTKIYQDPWVESVFVAKIWPNVLQIKITTHQIVAIWNEDSFLTLSGKVLQLTKEHRNKLDLAALPNFYAKSGEEDLVMQTYSLLSESLTPLGLFISSMEVVAEEGINIMLRNKIVLKLGTFDLFGRITRFVKAYRKKLHANLADIIYVDLRYTNGVAVLWGNVGLEQPNTSRY